MKNVIPLLFAATLAVGSAAAEDAQVISIQRLTLDTAVKVAWGAVEACREKGIQIAATVVDREGTVQVTLRDTIAAPITASVSKMKAYTAVNFHAPTSALHRRAESPIAYIDGLVMSPGGVPIQAAGALVGGVGVSGSPSGMTDEECALAGVAKVMDDLEMSF